MRQQFAVGIGLENCAVLLEIVGYLPGIHQVTLAGNHEVAALVAEVQRLHVLGAALGGVGILHAADSHRALQFADLAVGDYLAQQALAAIAVGFAVFVEGSDASAFLPAVLQVMQAVVNICRGVLYAINCKYSHIIEYPVFRVFPKRSCRMQPRR